MAHHSLQVLSALCLTLTAATLSDTALAQRGSPNPMAPRQLNVASYSQDHAYGYSILAGSAVDTLETPNRVVGWTLNYDVFDRYILRPVAHAYAALPQPVQTGVGNFTYNLSEPNNILNNLFIGEPGDSAVSLSRFVINSTIGILGFIDVASAMGLEPKTMEMKTVLGKAGMEQGPYLMIPVYGPTTGREVQGDTVDNLPYAFFPWFVGIGVWALDGIHSRAQLLDQEGVVDNALDPYVQTRDIYLMYSEGKVDPDAAMQQDSSEDEPLDEEFLDEIDG